MTRFKTLHRAPAAPPSSESAALSSVLVADPEGSVRQGVLEALRHGGTALAGEQDRLDSVPALTRKLQPALVICGAPTADEELLRLVAAVRAAGAAVLALSPVPDRRWVGALCEAGASALLQRPPRPADLLAAVEMTLAHAGELARLQRELSEARDRLETGALVRRAKAILVRRDGIPEAEAYQRLRRQAERTGRSLRAIAEALLLAERVSPLA
ncbi:MAG: ANTAR domain-containing response regulator [Armatimonadota bacterium]